MRCGILPDGGNDKVVETYCDSCDSCDYFDQTCFACVELSNTI